MQNSRSVKMWALFMVSPFVLCFLIFWFLPMLVGVWASLHDWNLASGNHGFVGLDNYKEIFTSGSLYNEYFMVALKNTLIFVLISVPPLVLIALALALIIDNLPQRLKPIFRTIYFVSYAISVTTVSAIFLWLFNENGGFFNNFLLSSGILKEPISWLSKQPFAWLSVLIATVWWTIGFNMILFINALDEVDQALYEAADLDGANFIKKFLYITLPQIKSVAYFIVILTVIASFNLYGQTRLITAGGPEQSTTSLIMNIQNTVLDMNQLGIGSAMAIIMGFIMLFITGAQYFLSYRLKEMKGGHSN